MAVKPLRRLIQNQAYHIVFMQLTCLTIIALLALIIFGVKSGYSVFAGGLVYGLPNLIFVWRVYRYAGSKEMAQFFAAFMIGEMLKLLLSAVLFLMIVKYLPVSLLSLIAGLVVAIVSFWIVSIWHFSSTKQTYLNS